jgi:hypothetical protein
MYFLSMQNHVQNVQYSYFITKILFKNCYLNYFWNLYTLQLWFNIILNSLSHKKSSITFSSTTGNIINIDSIFKLQLDHHCCRVFKVSYGEHLWGIIN